MNSCVVLWFRIHGGNLEVSLVLRNKTTLNRTYLLLWTFKETTPEKLSRKSHLNEHQAMHIPHIQYTKAIFLAVSNSSFVDQTIVPLQWRKFLNSLAYMQHLYMLVCDHHRWCFESLGDCIQWTSWRWFVWDEINWKSLCAESWKLEV